MADKPMSASESKRIKSARDAAAKVKAQGTAGQALPTTPQPPVDPAAPVKAAAETPDADGADSRLDGAPLVERRDSSGGAIPRRG